MRIVTWNCARRTLRSVSPLPADLRPDVLVLSEFKGTRQLQLTSDGTVWHEVGNGLGIGLRCSSPWRLEPVSADGCGHSAMVSGPISFPLLGIWSVPRPTYGQAVLDACVSRRAFLGEDRAVVAGDFNTFAASRSARNRRDHGRIVESLESEFGLKSAYHSFFDVAHGAEEHPTYYSRPHRNLPFHIDYCFVPRSWRIDSVQVGAQDHWSPYSDHMPLIVDVTPPGGVGAQLPIVSHD